MKNVIFVHHSTKLGIGTSHCLLQILERVRNEFRAVVVLDPGPGELPDVLRQMGIKYYVLPFRTILFLPALIFVILKENVDIVFGTNYSGRCKIALWAAKLTSRPFIWHIHEPVKENTKLLGYLSWANILIANSQATSDRLNRFAPHSRIVTIPNGVNLQDYQIDRNEARNYIRQLHKLPEKSILIANAGLICSRKNQLEVVELASLIAAKYPEVYFLFLGGDDDQAYAFEVKKRIHQLDLEGRVILTGFVRNINHYLLACDMLVHTARIEPQGLVILEAMAARLAVAAYDTGGIGESIVDGKTGFLLPFGDTNGLVQSVCKLIADPEARKCMGKAGYQRVKEYFPAEKTVKAVREVICHVLQQKQRI